MAISAHCGVGFKSFATRSFGMLNDVAAATASGVPNLNSGLFFGMPNFGSGEWRDGVRTIRQQLARQATLRGTQRTSADALFDLGGISEFR
jgi:hypothetical protein